MKVEAIANHYLRDRSRTGSFNWNDLSSDVDQAVSNRKLEIMDILTEVMPLHLALSPYFTRELAVKDLVELKSLFESELLPVDGTFFDQRFVNYLAHKPDLLKEINWRQFEGLAAEWLARSGYTVELGSGRNDGGVDVRAWNTGEVRGTPPAIIVQCKREKGKIGKVVVKALWADVYAEKAQSGLVVTSNDISPGAQKVIDARAYPVTIANRKAVESWLTEMRQPFSGVIL